MHPWHLGTFVHTSVPPVALRTQEEEEEEEETSYQTPHPEAYHP